MNSRQVYGNVSVKTARKKWRWKTTRGGNHPPPPAFVIRGFNALNEVSSLNVTIIAVSNPIIIIIKTSDKVLYITLKKVC